MKGLKLSIAGLVILSAFNLGHASTYRSVFLGYGLTEVNQSQQLTLSSGPFAGSSNRYHKDNVSQNTAVLGVGLGKTFGLFGTDASFGLQGGIIDKFEVEGEIKPMVNVSNAFDTLSFNYDVQTYFFMAEGGVRQKFQGRLGGYFGVGIGGAYNRLSNYREVPRSNSTAMPMIGNFGDNGELGLAYSVSIGLSVETEIMATLTLGYRYLNTDGGELGKTPAQITTQVLKAGKVGHHLLTLGLVV